MKTLLNTLYTWLRRSKSRNELKYLSDHDLKDIGLTRSQVQHEIRKPFWIA
jgi:uncharacterized protein YjiS (DUF1127 family)